MKKLLYLLLVLAPLLSLAQGGQPGQGIKMFGFTTYAGSLPGFYLPIFDANQNRKVEASVFFSNLLGTKTTSNLPEGSNRYFNEARARAAISVIGTGILYDPLTGILSTDFSTLDARYTTDLTFSNQFDVGEVISINLSKLYRYKKTVGDADYTITAEDGAIVLPDLPTNHTCYLPPASSMPSGSILIACFATVTGKWVLNGSFVQTATTGSSPFIENFNNSGLAPGQVLDLHSINDNGTWRWFDLH